MLRWVFGFLGLALIAGVFGFTRIAVDSMYIAKIFFFVFLVMFFSGLVYSNVTGRRSGGS